MNENLDLTKILDGCPLYTKFYSTIYGDVSFTGISDDSSSFNPIELVACTKPIMLCTNIYLTKDGKMDYNYEGECTLFPSKDQRDWSKFERFWDKSKKVEKFDPYTLQQFDKVLVRDVYKGCWACTLFSHIDNDVAFPVYCSSDCFATCIPYNDETKHLLGTTDDCPEYYKWWK